MAEQKIELRKVRDFSENLSDTFLFIKQNLKPLLISFLTIAGIFLLASSILNGVYQSQVGGTMWKDIMDGARDGAAGRTTRSPFEYFNGTYFFIPLLTWLGMTAMHVVIVAYMKLYEEKKNHASTTQEVWEVFKKYYFKVLISTLPVYIVIVIGFLFCLLPGIYLAVVLLPFPVVMIMEDVSFGTAFNRCFTIIKQNFWISLGIYIVVYLIYSFSSTIISSVFGLITGGISYLTTNDVATTMGVVMGIMQAFTFVFYIVFYVAVVLHYFTLTEEHDGTGIFKRLDTLGDTRAGYNNQEEQY